MSISEYIFRGFQGCNNHDCIIKKNRGMGTNGSCKCLHNLSRSQLDILKCRLDSVCNIELPERYSVDDRHKVPWDSEPCIPGKRC